MSEGTISFDQAIILGLIQGLTEFIPISSTAHLRILPAFMGWRDPGAAYSAVIQLGTFFALVFYFRHDLYRFTAGALRGIFGGRPFADRDALTAWWLVLATVPISVVGLLFARFITGEARSLHVIASSLIILAFLLQAADHFGLRRRSLERAGWQDYLLVGVAQCLALIPGSSRSGTTLTMGLVLGFDRETAMRISFLLGVPAIGLSGFYELFQEAERLQTAGFGGLLVGTLVSALSGYLAIRFLMNYLKHHSTKLFVFYRIGLGVLILALLGAGRLSPLG